MSATKQIRATAKQLLALSLEDGQLSETKVRAVLAWFEQKPPAHAAATLREYHRLVLHEVSRSRARIEFAGTLASGAVASIITELSRIYHRPISATTIENPALIAGVRVSIGDDVFERSVAGQLEKLATTTA
ncbi:MAG TPA: F0F1 ATP synthase subunit delta [Opitutaceae bacterium]|nr:F0F1 ATP synthase subunit delta [Opitutaceae bacterium]